MDLQTQEAVKRIAEEHGKDGVVVILGAPDGDSAGIAAETVVQGDPSWAGPLAGAQLGLPVFHVLDDEVRTLIPEDVFEEQVGIMADVIDAADVTSSVREFREAGVG